MLCPVCQSPNLDDARFCGTCGTPLEPVSAPLDAPSPGLPPQTSLRGGAFVLEELLGAGGFGLTYRARETGLSREVAVKEFFPFGSTRQNGQVVPPMGVSQDDWRRELAAFREEALTLARFSHPAIVRAYAVWAENGTAYFAMEFLRGQSLQKKLDPGYPLPIGEAVQIIEHIGAALALVHETGLLHRDIKPDNILLCSGRSVLIDFGTARAFAADQTTPMTQLLTPGYAPLEQYGRRARFGPFTDVYALAATLYHALSGQAPPPSPDRAAGVELRPLEELNPLITPALARAVETALEISVPKRPPTVEAWLQLLQSALAPPPTPTPFVPIQNTAPTRTPTILPSPSTIIPPTPTPSVPYQLPVPQQPPRRVPASTPSDASLEIQLPPESRTPSWFWPTVFSIPVLLFLFWLWYDPARGDLRAFDNQIRPILSLSRTLQTSYSNLGTASESQIAGAAAGIVPSQQRIVATLNRLPLSSEEARFSRDQLLDAETERLSALQNIANGEDLNSAFQLLRRAERDKAIWYNDYTYLLHQHRLR